MDYYTSDWHVGHRNIIRYSSRPFSSVDEMNEALTQRCNERVKSEDRLIVVGDCSLNEALVAPFLAKLTCKNLILVPGNHDTCHPAHRAHKKAADKKASADVVAKRYLDYGFKEVHLNLVIDEFVINHMPYQGKGELDEGYKEWRPTYQEGKTLVCGHIHNAWKMKTDPGLQINVGCDVWDYYPVSVDRIRAFLKEATNDC